MPSPLGPPYRIETPHVVLRCWEPAFAPALTALVERDLEQLKRRERWAGDEPKSRDQRLRTVRLWRAHFDLDHRWGWAAWTADGDHLAGAVGLVPNPVATSTNAWGWFSGNELHPEAPADAAAVIARVAIELLDAPRVQAVMAVDDERAAARHQALGFTRDGIERRVGEGARWDVALWSLLPGEWAASPAAARAAEARGFDVLGNRIF